MNLPSESIAEEHFITKVMRAIDRNPALINGLLHKVTPVVVHDPREREAFETLAVEPDGQRIERALVGIALGLYMHEYGNRWAGPVRVNVDFLTFLHEPEAPAWNAAIREMSAAADLLFTNVPVRGDNQEVFTYQVVRPADERIHAIMRMKFYGGCTAVAYFGLGGG